MYLITLVTLSTFTETMERFLSHEPRVSRSWMHVAGLSELVLGAGAGAGAGWQWLVGVVRFLVWAFLCRVQLRCRIGAGVLVRSFFLIF